MSKNLIIVESPNKVNKIQSFLDAKKYKVIASVGHIRDLTKQGEYGLGVDLESMQPKYSISREKRDVIKEMKRSALKSDKVFLATDPDREGEAIAWHIKEVIKNEQVTKEFNLDDYKKLEFKRITFNELTKEAVLESLKQPKDLNQNLIESQEARRILDRMIGFRLSKLAKAKVSARSAGRVKSVALKFIVDRENEIRNFKITYWYTIEGLLNKEEHLYNVDKSLVEIKYESDAEALKIHKELGTKFSFIKQDVKQKIVNPPAPLEMATFLIGMFSTHGMSNAMATMAAQSLYEKGLISYPRTDSLRISSQQFISQAKSFIEKMDGWIKVESEPNVFTQFTFTAGRLLSPALAKKPKDKTNNMMSHKTSFVTLDLKLRS